jgi:ATP-binding cassette subfamily F protein uup
MRMVEQTHLDLFDKKLKQEETWIRTGIKARRTRNEGRVRALKAMREAHRERRVQMGKVKSMTLDVTRSGQMVIEATKLNYRLKDKPLLNDFSFLLMRGDKVGIVGPNGCGKTTLIRLLLGELSPDSGTVRQGTSLSVAYFDQLRRQLDENQTVMANVAEGADYVKINGKQKHVASYLQDFLFSSERLNQPVSALSGGERNRLLLAKLFAKPVNLLVLDEPTNDLDMETLELLESMLMEYPGTLLLISHDRAFINQVVTNVLIYEGQGTFRDYVGGYDSWRHEQQNVKPAERKVSSPVVQQKPVTKLDYNEQRELSKLPAQIESQEKAIANLHEDMAKPGFYLQDAKRVDDVQQKLAEHEEKLARLYARWEELEEKGG